MLAHMFTGAFGLVVAHQRWSVGGAFGILGEFSNFFFLDPHSENTTPPALQTTTPKSHTY